MYMFVFLCLGTAALVAYSSYIRNNKIFKEGLNSMNEAYRNLTERYYITEKDVDLMKTASKDLTHVSIYFTDTTFTEMKESPLLEPFDLVSSIGGLMGIFLGMSLLSVCEILQFIFSVLNAILRHLCKFEKQLQVSSVRDAQQN